MSGIAGILRFDGAPVEPGLVQAMISTMARRGPDGCGYWLGESGALGHCMLRTTPESLEETQPLANDAGNLVLVLDGRVDNWEELRRELLARGAILRTRADAELVLRAFEVWGANCLSRIEGDFAFAILDTRARTVFCARDPIGHKPFHYHWDGRTFTFASEPQAVLAMPWIRQVPNEGMLAEYLAADWHSRVETFWVGVLRLVAAHRMLVGSGGPHPQRYWEPDLSATLPYKRDEEYFEHYRELLMDSVRRMSRSYRPVSSHVSGGLDSSAVFSMAHHLQQQGRLPAPGLQGRTLAFPGHPDADELFYSRAVGRHLGVTIREHAPTRLLPHAWYADWAKATMSYPGSPNTTMLLGLIQSVAAEGGKVILTGMGGDEWLWTAHHAYYDEELAQRNWRELWRALRADAGAYGGPTALYWLMRHGVFFQLPESVKAAMRASKKQLRRLGPRQPARGYWLAPRMLELIEQRRRSPFDGHSQPARRAGQRYLLFRQYETVYDDMFREHDERMCASHGVEERNPMFNTRFIQFAFSTPDRLRRHGIVNKFIHVQAMRGLLPPEVLDRRVKADFSVVTYDHVNHWGAAFAKKLAQQWPDWVTPQGMASLWKAYESGPEPGGASWFLWCLYVAEIMGNQMRLSR